VNVAMRGPDSTEKNRIRFRKLPWMVAPFDAAAGHERRFFNFFVKDEGCCDRVPTKAPSDVGVEAEPPPQGEGPACLRGRPRALEIFKRGRDRAIDGYGALVASFADVAMLVPRLARRRL